MSRMLYQSCKLKKKKKNYKFDDWQQIEFTQQSTTAKYMNLLRQKYDKLTTNWTIIWQNSQNKQHSQYKIHYLFSPCKPPTFSKSTTHHSSNVDT